MIGYLQRLTIRNIVSPYGLAFLSFLVFLFAWLFPPQLYMQYVNEPDLMFLEPFSFVFFTVCLLAFLAGVRASRFFGAPLESNAGREISVRNSLTYLLPPLLFAAAFGTVYLVKMGGKINFVALLASQQGNAIKVAGGAGQMSEGRWDESVPLLTVILWWSFYRALQLRLKGAVKVIYYSVLLYSTVLGLFIGVATVNRANLMPIVLGLLIVGLFPRTRNAHTRVARLLLVSAAGSVGSVGAFLLLSFLRGAMGLNLLITGLLGYTIVSYNRMAALLTGVLHYAYEGRGVYLNPFLLGDEKVNYLFHLADRFGWPTSLALWQTEFSSTSAAGLNPTFIWSGAFGYVFSDIGWFSPLYWCLIGLLSGWVWARFTAGRSVGLVLYPWIAFSILMWCGPNFIFRTNFVQYCEFAVLLHMYDMVFLRRPQPVLSAEQLGGRRVLPEPVSPFFAPAPTGIDRGVF
jgi:hypothetical protein